MNQHFSFRYISENYCPPPPAPPYTGTLLPAVIYVSDLDVKLEELSVTQLQASLDKLSNRLASLDRQANASCQSLEPQFKDHVKAVVTLTSTLQKLHMLIAEARRKKQQPNEHAQLPEESTVTEESQSEDVIVPNAEDEEPVSQHLLKHRRQAERLEKERKRYQRVGKRIKVLFRKIMSLTHEERVGKNPHLRELYDLAVLARSNHDEDGLQGILKMAESLQSNQGMLALINSLKIKKQALRDMLKQVKKSLQNQHTAPHVQVHNLLKNGRKDQAAALFQSMLDNQILHLSHAIQQAEFELSGETGTFSNRTTTTTFHFRF